MATASLTADLLARKGRAQPTGKWMRSGSVIMQQVPAPSGQLSGKVQSKSKGAPVTKTLRLDKTLNRQLKLLAARADVSQQAIMEQAVRHFVATEFEKADCICGADMVPVI